MSRPTNNHFEPPKPWKRSPRREQPKPGTGLMAVPDFMLSVMVLAGTTLPIERKPGKRKSKP